MSLNVGELVATLTVDDSRFTRAMQSATQQAAQIATTATTASRQASTALGTTADAADRVAERSRQAARATESIGTGARQASNGLARIDAGNLTAIVRGAENAGEQLRQLDKWQLNALIREANRAGENIGQAVRQGASHAERALSQLDGQGLQRLIREAEQARRELNQVGDAAGEAAEEAAGTGEDAGSSSGGSFLEGFKSKIGDLGGKGGPIAASLLGVAGVGLAAGALLMGAIQDGMERESQLDLVQAKLGINEDTARKIGAAAGQSYSAGWGESVEQNMDAARAAIQSGLLTGEEDTGTMKATIDQLNIVASIMGEEIPALTRSAAQAVKTGFAEDAPAALDMFVKAQQAGLNTSEDFLDTMDEYSTQFRKLGLEGPEAMGLMSQALKNGARDTDTAADALKEFAIRAVDGSESSAKGYERIGLSAEEMTAKIARGGQDAREGLDQVLDGLRSIEDPVERNAAAVELFGTKAEDMGDALFTMDLSTAVRELGEVEGAAAKAGDTMSSNTAASFESAKRSMETSMDDIKLALAEGFGPALTDMANWVTTHKPEIIGFLTDLADAGFKTLDGVLAFVSGSLRAFAMLSDGVADVSADGLNALGALAEGFGGVIKHVPGMRDTGEALESVGSGMQTMSDKMESAGDTARSWADTIDNTLRPGVRGIGDDVVKAGRDAEQSTRLMQALGSAVVKDIPDEKSIIIDSNTPQQQSALEQLGLTVQALPDGTFVVTANTTEGQNIIDNFVLGNDGRTITMNVQTRALNPMPGVTIPQPGRTGGRSYDGTIVGGLATRADGAFTPKNTNAHIQRNQITVYGEPETEGESYIPHAPSKRARSMSILTETARKFGFGLVREFADGGVVEGLTAYASEVAPALQMTSGYRNTDNGHHSTGNAADFSNGYGNTDEQLAFANLMVDRYQKDLLELIYDDPRFNREVKNGQIVDRSFYDGAGDHTNHVHVAMRVPPQQLASAAPAEEPGSVDPNSKQGIANTIIAEGRKRGMSQKQIKAALMAGLAETDLQNLDYGMDGDNAGILQQRSVGWGSLEDRKDPATAVGMFYDKLAKLDENSMTEAQLAQAVQQSGTEDGSNYAAKAAEAEALLASSSPAPTTAPTTASPSTASGVTDTGVAMSTDGQRVYVTNWPAALGGDTAEKPADERVPVLTAGLKVFANGGIEDHTAQIVGAGDMRLFGEPETGGEGYIPLAPSKRPRSVAITKQIANRFGYHLVPMADGGLTGFGGWQNDDRPTLDIPLDGRPVSANKARANAYALTALGIGGLNTLLSGFDGKGQFTGKFDTGSNSPALLEEGVSMITARLDELIEAAKNPDPVDVQVDIDQGSRTANLAITKAGL